MIFATFPKTSLLLFLVVLIGLVKVCQKPKLPEIPPVSPPKTHRQENPNSNSLTLDNAVLQEIRQLFEELYHRGGNFSGQKPSIEIINSSDQVANYNQNHNKIRIEQKAIEICQGFGPFKKIALALVIGHELGHHLFGLQHGHQKRVGFFCSGKEEQQADVLGVFLAYLVCGDQVDEIVPAFLDKIYAEYDHLNVNSKLGSSILKKRKQTTDFVKSTAYRLRRAFEVANYLAAAGQYDLAIACYQYIKPYYNAREIAINLGLCQMLKAKQLKNDPYYYPMHYISDTQLETVKDLPSLAPEKYQRLLKAAIGNFKQAIKLNKGLDTKARINIIVATCMAGKYAQALDLGDQLLKQKLNPFEISSIKLLKGISKLLQVSDTTQAQEGRTILQIVAADQNSPLLSTMANYNLAVDAQKLPALPFQEAVNCKQDDDLATILENPFQSLGQGFEIAQDSVLVTRSWKDYRLIEFRLNGMVVLRMAIPFKYQATDKKSTFNTLPFSMLDDHCALQYNGNENCPRIRQFQFQHEMVTHSKTIILCRFQE